MERVLREQGLELTGVLEAIAEAVTIRDPHHHIVYANRAALRHLGFESLEELRRRDMHSVMDEYLVHDEHGRRLSMDDIPSVRLLRGQDAEPLLMRTVNVRTGETRWERLKTAPLYDRDGQVAAAVTVIEDMTALMTADMHTRLLAESGRVLASSLDYEQTLHNIAELAVPDFADWCAVELVDECGRREPAVLNYGDSTSPQLVEWLRSRSSPQLDPTSTTAQVMTSGRSVLLEQVTEEDLSRAARSGEHLEMLRRLGARSAIVAPLSVPSRRLGVITFMNTDSRRRFRAEDVELAEQLGRRAAVAVENSRLHTRLARVAETLQESLRPAEVPDVQGWEIAALYRPAGGGQRLEVGGDFYEVFGTEKGALALIGDVTGHGVAAATLTSMMRFGARFAGRLEPEPAAIIRRLDAELRHRGRGELCTALCAALRPGELVLCSAGHPPALIADRGGRVRERPEPGPLLGAFPDAEWRQVHLPVGTEQLVLLYTDGVPDTAGPGGRFGTERLRELLSEHCAASPAELLAALERALDEVREGPGPDDVAALALRATG